MSTEKLINMNFELVINRLKQALNLKKDSDIADLLGFTKTTFSQRKKRGALPVDKIKLICNENSLSEDWIFNGTGEMYVSEPIHLPYGDLPQLSESQLEAARILGMLSVEDQAKMIDSMKKEIIERLTGKKTAE
ncbi:MAG: hypothetical protein EHM79_02115 [Geobacter sp.]|nr:MAG: hypothetical protein EHM79_02115 [Geobacter sp.]